MMSDVGLFKESNPSRSCQICRLGSLSIPVSDGVVCTLAQACLRRYRWFRLMFERLISIRMNSNSFIFLHLFYICLRIELELYTLPNIKVNLSLFRIYIEPSSKKNFYQTILNRVLNSLI